MPSKQSRLSAYRALCVALGGTIGVGNTVGVSAALAVGGPGAIFWMWISAGLCMSLKYAEIDLAAKYRTGDRRGGAMYLLSHLRKPALAILFSVACVFASFGMGNLAQSMSAEASLHHSLGIPKFLTALLLTCVGIAVFSGGRDRLIRFSGVFVPIMGILFLVLSFAVLWCNRQNLPNAVGSIFAGAFRIESFAAGSAAAGFLKVFSSGFERAIFSNEAGLGSAPLIHASAENDPVSQGLWGAAEVFFDTILVCTICALVILSDAPPPFEFSQVSELCAQAFKNALGSAGGILFSVSLCFFAISSILAWCYYGMSAIRFLFSSRIAPVVYCAIFFAFPFLAPIIPVSIVFAVSDLANACMVFPNLFALFCLRKEVDPPQIDKKQG